ncbi:WXG100 family type VII secretion target [Streptomyces sp. NPDC058548]|uniref:WXG100 family type VII secretion target n=1 Tax=unclassified Streptomyces TaxID=2593676 RepID=UPI00365FD644
MTTPPQNNIADGFQAGDVNTGGFSYDAGDIIDGSNVLKAQHQAVTDRVAQMFNTVNAQTEGWLGASGDEFRAKLGEIRGNLDVIAEWMTQASDFMVSNAEGVQADDATYASRLGSI